MPIVFSGLVDVATRFNTSVDAFFLCPFHFAAGTPIAAAVVRIVLFVAGRMNMKSSSVHGFTWPALPKPKVK